MLMPCPYCTDVSVTAPGPSAGGPTPTANRAGAGAVSKVPALVRDEQSRGRTGAGTSNQGGNQ